MKTYQAKPAEVKREWHLVDAKGKVLGQLCTQIATLLMGKHKVTFTPHVDSGDFVVVINAKHLVVTGTKADTKVYSNYSGYPGGLKTLTFSELMKRDPAKILEHGVKGMISKNKMRDPRLARLKIFADATHTYGAQVKKEA